MRLDIASVLLAGAAGEAGDGLLFDLDAELAFESFTSSGRRWGFVAGGRAERDGSRTAWGGLAGDCPAAFGDCASIMVGGQLHPVRAPVSGFQSVATERDDALRLALTSAYAFVDLGWGEVRLGYGPGAADLDPEQGPTAFRLSRADGGRVDLTGLSGARTRNLSSGRSPKLVFRSITLGQTSTIGAFRVSSSFTPAVRDCGVDHCARDNGPAGLLVPEFDNVWEIAGRYEIRRGDHEYAFSLGASQGDAASNIAGFAGISTRDAGFSWTHGALSAGARWLRSNNGVDGDGSYEAWSASIGLESGPWLTTLEAARFSDDLAHVDGQTWQLSTSRLVGDHWIVGGGVQHADRHDPFATSTGRRQIRLDGSAVFLELGWQF